MLQNDENLFQGQETDICSTRRNINGHMAQGGYDNPVDLSSKLINVNGYIKTEAGQNGGYSSHRERTPVMGGHREPGGYKCTCMIAIDTQLQLFYYFKQF